MEVFTVKASFCNFQSRYVHICTPLVIPTYIVHKLTAHAEQHDTWTWCPSLASTYSDFVVADLGLRFRREWSPQFFFFASVKLCDHKYGQKTQWKNHDPQGDNRIQLHVLNSQVMCTRKWVDTLSRYLPVDLTCEQAPCACWHSWLYGTAMFFLLLVISAY